MELVYAFLATHAQANNGKLTVVDGEFDTVQVSSLPGTPPPFYAVVKARITPTELATPHTFRIEFSSPSGHRSPPHPAQPIPFAPNPRGSDEPCNALLIAMIATGLDVEGEYGVHVFLDDLEVIRLPLIVSRAPTHQ